MTNIKLQIPKPKSQQNPNNKIPKCLDFGFGSLLRFWIWKFGFITLIFAFSLSSCAKKEYSPVVAFKGDTTNIGLKYCPKCGQVLKPNVTRCDNAKCESAKSNTSIKFGEIKLADTRTFEVLCQKCGLQIKPKSYGVDKCPNKACLANLKWGNIKCGFCDGSGLCSTCEVLQQKGGKCFNCVGKGYLSFGVDCPNCAGIGKCPICGGTGKCTYCGGKGFLTLDELKTRVPKEEEEFK